MDYVELPNGLKGPHPWMFLAGGITGCHQWQNEVRHGLEDYPHGTMVNPRRSNWDMEDLHIADQQIRLEFQAIHQCNIFSIWFTNATLQPISLFELAAALTRFRMNDARLKALVIGVHPEYARRLDVDVQCELALGQIGSNRAKSVWMCHDFSVHMENMKLALEKVWKASGNERTC